MLYLKEDISATRTLAVWRLDESTDELLSLIQPVQDLGDVLAIKSESRVLERLATLLLVKLLTGDEKEIGHRLSGAPYLVDGSWQISVSHTKGYVAVMLSSEDRVGIDVERVSEKVKAVRPRLVADDEYIDPANELVHLLLHWSAKEAMFKYIETEGVDFRRHLHVKPFTPQSEGVFTACECRTRNKYCFDAHYRVTDDFVLVYLLCT